MAKLSIVTTLYYSEHFLLEFYRRITDSAKKITDDFELVFVNDGSPDNTLKLAIDLHQTDSRVRVIDLSRNFGHHKAIQAGLAHASGELIFLIDADLEEPPELLTDFYQAFLEKEEQIDSIYGVQQNRKGGLIERSTGSLFYKLFNRLSGINMEESPLTVRLMSRRYVDALLLHQENELFLAGIFHITGFTQRVLRVNKNSNEQSTYTLRHKLGLMSRGITSFSSVPLHISFYSGFIMAFSAFVFGLYLVSSKIFFGDAIEAGWTSLMVSIWFIGGVLLCSQGIIGIYLSKVYSEVKLRPNYIVRNIYSK
ncbi:glycosyltransferase family 2 protein [Planctobacterium marinum]|uniref:glycosyltransferase family 2 protein n=1 Tax=Planctobacterium marinum TaxID=1631968 RepID=UPI001E65C23C|nr:glycosyltransferase family 2 protein [Planctobacterium marinum]MCC2606120.1 glycosyltransferase family 2 protein [Planctobacterium marinum]